MKNNFMNMKLTMLTDLIKLNLRLFRYEPITQQAYLI